MSYSSTIIERYDGPAMAPDIYQPPFQDIELAAVLAALSDPVRLAIVSEIHEQGQLCCGAVSLDLAKSTLSHHLKVLREAGVTWTEADGVERHLTLRYDCLQKRFPGLLESVLNATSGKARRTRPKAKGTK